MVELDALVQRIQALPGWEINQVAGEKLMKFKDADPRDIAAEMIIVESDLGSQVDMLPAQVLEWGRLVAMANRALQSTQRKYRQWRDGVALSMLEAAKDAGEKKPTEAHIDRSIRDRVEYAGHYAKQEAAEDALRCCEAVLEAFKTKRFLMERFVRLAHDRSTYTSTI